MPAGIVAGMVWIVSGGSPPVEVHGQQGAAAVAGIPYQS